MERTPPLATIRDPREETDFSDFMDAFAGDVKDYLRTEKEYLLLQASKRAAEYASRVAGALITIILLGGALLMLSVGAAVALGRAWNDPVLGWLFVGGLYAVVGLIVMLLWKGPLGRSFTLNIINELNDEQEPEI